MSEKRINKVKPELFGEKYIELKITDMLFSWVLVAHWCVAFNDVLHLMMCCFHVLQHCELQQNPTYTTMLKVNKHCFCFWRSTISIWGLSARCQNVRSQKSLIALLFNRALVFFLPQVCWERSETKTENQRLFSVSLCGWKIVSGL